MCRNKKLAGIITLIVLATLITSQISYASQKDTSEDTFATESENGYETVKVRKADYTETFEINSVEWTYLRSDILTIEEEKGTFVEYLVTDEQIVKKGDALAAYALPGDRIQLEEKQILLERSRSQFEEQSIQKEAVIADIKVNLDKLDKASLEAQILALKLQRLEIEYDQFVYQAQKNLELIEDTIKSLQSDMETHYLYAPYDGLIHIRFSMKEGSELDTSTELLDISDIDSAVLGIDAGAHSKLRYHMEVLVTGVSSTKGGKDTEYTGVVVGEDSVLNNKVTTGKIYIALENPELATTFKRAHVSAVTVSVPEVLLIPQKVVVLSNGSYYVYVLDEDGAIHKQYITGRKNDTDMWVYSGLSEGQHIIVE